MRPFSDTYRLFFSKTKDQRPLTNLKIGPKPCQNPHLQAHDAKKDFYPGEIMRREYCEQPDERYEESGFVTDEKELYDQNAINDVLENKSSY